MAVYQRPGVYVNETLNPTPPSAGVATLTRAAFLGPSNQGPLGPTLITSWSQFVRIYGSWKSDTTDLLRHAVHSYLVDNAGGECYVSRVAGSGWSVASRSFYDSSGAGGSAGATATLQVNASNP